jgi:hypothetical protein
VGHRAFVRLRGATYASEGRRIVSAELNIETVKAMYEAFGRGDVAAVLEQCTDDVDWPAQ